MIIAMLVAAVILLLVWEPPASGDDALTVLPFESMTGPDEEFFSRGLSIELQSLLAQLRRFKVKSQPVESILARFPDVSTLAKEMGVRWVLKGSVRQADNRVRIAVQLIDANDDESIAWSNVFDRELSATNLFAVQAEIARSIASELRQSLDEPAERRLAAPPTENMEAYYAYLLGRQRLDKRKVAELANAVEQFSLAIELDPQFAGAYAGLADACYLYAGSSGGKSIEHCPSSRAGREQLARKALELDPECAEAWISLGTAIWNEAVRMHADAPQPKIRDKLHEALAAFERGLELNPTLPDGYYWYGSNLMFVHAYPDPPFGWIKAWQAGRWQSVFDKGLEVDPLSINLHARKTWYPITVSSEEEAMWHARRVVEIAPDSPRGYGILGGLERALNGRIDESIRWVSKAMSIDPQNPGRPMSIGRAYFALGDPDMALAYLDLAKAIAAGGNSPVELSTLVEEIAIGIVSGKDDVYQVAERVPFPIRDENSIKFSLGVFVDLATGRPANALARIKTVDPECIGAKEIPYGLFTCPSEMVRAYQELGDEEAAQALSDAIVRRDQLLVEEYPVVWMRLDYAGTLATAGRTDEALDELENLVGSGWRGDNYYRHPRFTLCCDVRFDAIRDTKRFQAIVATFEADMAQQLENVREMERNGEIPTLEDVYALIESAQESS